MYPVVSRLVGGAGFWWAAAICSHSRRGPENPALTVHFTKKIPAQTPRPADGPHKNDNGYACRPGGGEASDERNLGGRRVILDGARRRTLPREGGMAVPPPVLAPGGARALRSPRPRRHRDICRLRRDLGRGGA